ncbi:MAG TPA: ATP-binding protein [Rudaea sp.]|nr:ATP-binding protein [Rudaea sp.]
MRIRLWQRLFLAFAALSGLALFAFAAWQARSFSHGFLHYLDEVTLEQRLAPAAQRLAERYAQHGDWEFLRRDPALFGELVEPRPRPRDRLDDDPRPRPPPPDDDGPPPPDRPPPPGAPPRPHAPHGPPELMPRLALVDAAGERVAGNPRVPPDSAALPVELGGRRIGTLLLAPLPQLSGAADLAFAQAQRRSGAIAAAAILVGALLLALALARSLLAPVRALAAGTRALAAGDYTRRIETLRRDELGELSDDFNRLAVALAEARDARRQWGADIAHELRTPLAILRGEIQALEDGVRAPTPQAFQSLTAECERLGHLIEDLYQLALADAGALEYRFETVDLAELVRETVELQQPVCADAGLGLDATVGAGARVRGDPRRLGQLLDNLLANARRYTDAPGRIRVVLHASGKHVRLVVEDSAPGVPASALPHLFDRLYRVDASRSRASGGAGLGLAICRAIVAAHQGRIEARPSPLGGLCVIVDLAQDETA